MRDNLEESFSCYQRTIGPTAPNDGKNFRKSQSDLIRCSFSLNHYILKDLQRGRRLNKSEGEDWSNRLGSYTLRRLEWKVNVKSRTQSNFTLDRDGPPMSIYHIFYNFNAEPCPSSFLTEDLCRK